MVNNQIKIKKYPPYKQTKPYFIKNYITKNIKNNNSRKNNKKQFKKFKNSIIFNKLNCRDSLLKSNLVNKNLRLQCKIK